MRVSLALALPGRQEVIELDLPEGSTVGDAIAAAGIEGRFPGIALSRLRPGIWSRECAAGTPLREGDRVELYRELVADPRQQRRDRARAPRR